MQRDPNCTLCKLHSTCSTVCLLGVGPKRSDVMVIGEAPGKYEDQRGEAFVGRSGELLMTYLGQIGLDKENCYVTNAVNCRPPENRTPTKAEIRACRKWLDYQIEMVKPKYILLLGNVPLQSALGMSGIRKLRGKPIEKDGIVYLPTYHPAYVLREPDQAYLFKNDLDTFKRIIDFGGIPYERAIDYVVVDTWAKVDQMCEALVGTVSSDDETSGLYPWAGHIVTMGFGTKDKQWIIPVKAEAWDSPWSHDELLEIVERISERLDDCFLVGHNWKFDRLWNRVYFGADWRCDFDTMLAHYMINENDRHGLDYLASLYFGAPNWDVPLELKQGKKGRFKDHCLYLAQDLYYTRKLRFHLQRQLDKDPQVKRVHDKIMIPSADLFAEAEYHGVWVDSGRFDEAEEFLRGEVDKYEGELKQFGDINWGSPKQIADLLYTQLKIPVPMKTKKGAPSTSESALNMIDHPCVAALVKCRGAKQQLSFFIEGWKPYLVNNRLHPSFKLHGTVTGRLSCEHPNFQQIPRDKRIRSLITAAPGYTLVEADLSQIELRIAAELSSDRNLTYAFNHGIDVHWLTAIREIARGGGLKDEVIDTAGTWTQNKKIKYADAIEVLLKMGPDAATEIFEGWKEFRKKAKAVNFGYLFGMWWKKFKIYARDNYGVHITDEQARESREAFFDLYGDLTEWHNKQRAFVRAEGYVRTLTGRKRRLPHAMMRDNTPERQEAERQAINSPVQGFANEINIMTAIQVRREFKPRHVQLIATVHDACLFEVRDDWVSRFTPRLLEIMSRPDMFDEFNIKLSIPVEADAKVGPWGSGVSLAKWEAARA